MPLTSQLCDRCGVRWKQDGSWCRGCAIETGLLQTLVEAERQRRLRLQADQERVRSQTATDPDRSPRPDLVRVIRGVEWIVSWDGS